MPAAHTSSKIGRLKRRADALGGPELIPLNSEIDASQLEYLDLLPSKTGAFLLPAAAAELQGRILLYLVDNTVEEGTPPLQVAHVQNPQTLLANRSEHARLGIV